MKYFSSISFGLHDIDIDAHDFHKWAKKEEENSTIKFYFLSMKIIMKDRSSWHRSKNQENRILFFIQDIRNNPKTNLGYHGMVTHNSQFVLQKSE